MSSFCIKRSTLGLGFRSTGTVVTFVSIMATNQSSILGGRASTNIPSHGIPMQQHTAAHSPCICLNLNPVIEIPVYPYLEGLVCGSKEEDPRDVVLFGDQAIFTFSIALASLRANGSSGMTTACYKQNPEEEDAITIPDFVSKKTDCLEWCIKNGNPDNTWSLKLPSEATIANIKAVLDVRDFSHTWRNDIDAIPLRIPRGLMVAGKVVWFQCPWIPRRNKSYSTFDLIKDFMKAMKDRQKDGDYLLLGIVNNQSQGYVEEYHLSEILKEVPGELGYRFQGGDNKFIEKILGRGYKHEAFQHNIHDLIFKEHVTLVFKRDEGLMVAGDEGLAGMMNKMDINDDPLVTQVTKNGVVVFKEEDISFRAALANLNDKKWDGIEMDHLPDDLCLSMIEKCIFSGEKLQLHPDEIIKNIVNVRALQVPQIEYPGKVVWYQLPPSSEVKMEQVESFMRNIGRKQAAGDYLLIGTTTSSQFIDLKIEEMIGDGNEGHAYNGYKFIRIDVKLIQKISASGYKNGSCEAKVFVYKKEGKGEEA